jgi:hypothetical protein
VRIGILRAVSLLALLLAAPLVTAANLTIDSLSKDTPQVSFSVTDGVFEEYTVEIGVGGPDMCHGLLELTVNASAQSIMATLSHSVTGEHAPEENTQYQWLLNHGILRPNGDCQERGTYTLSLTAESGTWGETEVTVHWITPTVTDISLENRSWPLQLDRYGVHWLKFTHSSPDLASLNFTTTGLDDGPDTKMFLVEDWNDQKVAEHNNLGVRNINNGGYTPQSKYSQLSFGDDPRREKLESDGRLFQLENYTLLISGAGTHFEDQIVGSRPGDFGLDVHTTSLENPVVVSCSQRFPSRAITRTNTWYMLSLPCVAPEGSKFSNLFGGDEPDGWAAWSYNSIDGIYQPLLATSTMPGPGVGFWFISYDEPTVLTMPANSTAAVSRNSRPCATGQPCTGDPMAVWRRWSLAGNPGTYNVRYADLQFTNDASSCSEDLPCSIEQVTEEMEMPVQLFVFSEPKGHYLPVNADSTVNASGSIKSVKIVRPWQGFWSNVRSPTASGEWKMHLRRERSFFLFVTDTVISGSELSVWEDHPNTTAAIRGEGICDEEATAAGLAGIGSFNAWLGDGYPAYSFLTWNVPYLRPDGAFLFQGWKFGSPIRRLAQPVSVTPTLAVAANEDAWTATTVAGAPTGLSDEDIFCDFGSPNPVTTVGNTGAVDAAWTEAGTRGCTNSARLYCMGGQ